MHVSNSDVVDRLSLVDRATYLDIAVFVISIISYLLDIFFDCYLAYHYYDHQQLAYFFTTSAFIIIPAFINTVFSVRIYILDIKNGKIALNEKRRLCFTVYIFQLAPVLRYFYALKFAIKSKIAEKNKNERSQKKYYKLMVDADSDLALLKVLDCFLGAAPQQILQLAIIFNTDSNDKDRFDSSDIFTCKLILFFLYGSSHVYVFSG